MAAGRGGYNSPALTVDSPAIAMDYGRGGYNGPNTVLQIQIQPLNSAFMGGNGNGGDDSGRGGYN